MNNQVITHEVPETTASIIPMNLEHVRQVAGRMADTIGKAAKVSAVRVEGTRKIKSECLSYAVECRDRVEFQTACNMAEGFYRIAAKTKSLPQPWNQAKSDIKSMFDYNIALRDEHGKPLPIEMCEAEHRAKKKAAKKAADADALKQHEAMEKALPESVKEFRVLVGLLEGLNIPALFEACNAALKDVLEQFHEEHPELFEKVEGTATSTSDLSSLDELLTDVEEEEEEEEKEKVA